MEEEHLKTVSSSNATLGAKGNHPRSNKNRGRPYKKVPRPYQKNGPKSSVAKMQKAKGNGEKNIVRVKCYNCGKKGHYAWDCPELPKVSFLYHTPKLYVHSRALVVNSLANSIVDTGTSKHIVRDKDNFVDFHRYPVGSQTVVLGNGSEEDVLGVGTYKVRLHGENTLLLHDALYAPGVQVCLLSLVSLMKFGFSFNSSTNGFNIMYGGNVWPRNIEKRFPCTRLR